MRKFFKGDDRGFTLGWLAMILTLLLGMAGFGTDLGWLYLNTVRTQNAVDAAALAGVVNLPGFDPQPDAEAAARANGYDPGGADTLTLTQTEENELHAELRTSIEPFFLRALGFDQFNITREATARYVKPVPLGSPSNCFGGGSLIPGGSCSGDEDFWAAVSGRHTRLEDGDPYSTLCDLNSPCDSGNANYARAGAYTGYYYGVEVETGMSNLQVFLWDASFEQRTPIGSETGDALFAGGGGGPDVHTTFRLYPPDTTPLIPDDHLTGGPLCTQNYAPGAGSAVWNWTQLCGTIGSPTPGIYLVYVETTNNSAGSNNFAIRAEAGGGTPRVYGINDMSIWSNNLSAASELFLAEIAEEHAGKKLELAFYDAGDANGQSFYYVRDPFGNVPTCSYTVWTADWPLPSASQVGSGSGQCEWETQVAGGSGSGVYNKQWIVAIIDLPEDPADMCNESAAYPCFWKMDLDLAQPTERTTWRARVIGNPVRLIP